MTWKPPTAAMPSDALVDFVLRHAHVKTNVCTRVVEYHGYTLALRTVPDYNLIYAMSGRPVWVIRDRPVALSPGKLLIVPPHVPHHAYSRSKRVTIGSVHVEVTLSGGQDVFELLVPPLVQDVAPGGLLDTYLRGAMREFDRVDTDQTYLMLPHWSRLIVLEMLRCTAQTGLLRTPPVDPLVAELLNELNRRISRPTSLSDLAAWSGYSPQYLNRLFRRVLGVTPLQHLQRLRMQRGAALLIEGRLTVRGVARKLGFDDPYYFSRVFKQHFGRSPAQYRQAAGSESPS